MVDAARRKGAQEATARWDTNLAPLMRWAVENGTRTEEQVVTERQAFIDGIAAFAVEAAHKQQALRTEVAGWQATRSPGRTASRTAPPLTRPVPPRLTVVRGGLDA